MAKRSLPFVLAGPIVRRARVDHLCLWLALSKARDVRVTIGSVTHIHRAKQLMRAGEALHYALIDMPVVPAIPHDTWVSYTVEVKVGRAWKDITAEQPDLLYPNQTSLGIFLTSHVRRIMHGSCRKPHHASGDGLVAVDVLLEEKLAHQDFDTWPAALVMSGDQVYMDDVAGPMLVAIHQAIDLLGLPPEALATLDASVPDMADALYVHPKTYYQREGFLPTLEAQAGVWQVLFGGVRKPVFTADHAHNHVITLAESLVMYLMVWSPALWDLITLEAPEGLSDQHRALFETEHPIITDFVAGLSRVRRMMAHVPVAMIFDDHDVTDDWNLHRSWEDAAYSHPFSRRIIGNALVAYLINQGWGNRPEVFSHDLMDGVQAALTAPGSGGHDSCIDDVLRFEQWDFEWDTAPSLVVLDTRTRRWRSEDSPITPSGLLDWEAVTDLQRSVRMKDSIILVSAAPIFGVKLIEAIQKLFTVLRQPLMVDAEYWMAHPGTAEAVLNVFRHRKTPRNFTILSGDVHYSFVYDVELRSDLSHTDIWQICSSGFKNEFPSKLLHYLDEANRWLFAPRSPLNWLTKRRRMLVTPRKPLGTDPGRRLLCGSGVGVVTFNSDGAPINVEQVLANGDRVAFEPRAGEAREE